MKPFILALSLSTLLASAVEVEAQSSIRPQVAPKAELKTKIDPGKIGGGIVVKKEAVGERYSLHMSFAPRGSDTDQSNGGNTSFDCYGTLKINGETWWEMPRKTSDQVNQQIPGYFIANNVPVDPDKDGYSLTKNSQFNKGRKFEFDVYSDKPQTGKLKISLRLWDADTYAGSTDLSKDDLFGKYDVDLDLLKNGAGSYRWFWVDGNQNGSDFYLVVKHEKTLYESPDNGLRKPETKPVIDKPLIPGKIPGPGPVIKTSPMKRVIR